MANFLKINDNTILELALIKGFGINQDYGLPVFGGSMEFIEGYGGNAGYWYYPYALTSNGCFPLCDWLNSKEKCKCIIQHTLEIVMNDTNSSMICLDEWIEKMLKE